MLFHPLRPEDFELGSVVESGFLGHQRDSDDEKATNLLSLASSAKLSHTGNCMLTLSLLI
jgi:hypothetical protein